MDGKIKNNTYNELTVKKSFNEDYKWTTCSTRHDSEGRPVSCSSNCVLFGEPKTTADGKTEIEICQGRTLTFNTFTIE